jgi:uncharacterized protein (DUF362 family)
MMNKDLSRRSLLRFAGAGALGFAAGAPLAPQEAPVPQLQLPPAPIVPVTRRSTVSLVKGEDRSKMVYEALMGIDPELRAALKRKKTVLIKPNLTSVTIQLASTHADTLRAILEYLGPRFKGPIVIAESASGDTNQGFENFKYNQLVKEFASQKVSLVDLNDEGLFEPMGIVTYNVHPQMIRIAKRLLDPDTFILNPCIPKMHNAVVMTAAVKNMVVGGTLRSGRKDTRWTDKQKFHAGPHQMNYNMLLVAQKMAPYWGATVVDGYEGMEGDGPVSGQPVPHRIAFASLDYIAADRVAVDLMGIDPKWVGYLQYCEQFGLGNYDIAKIDVRGETIDALKRTYRLHPNVNLHIQWMGPLVPDQGFGRSGQRRGI